MTSDIKERYLNNWSDDLNSEMWTGVEMIKFAASIRAETLEECAKIAEGKRVDGFITYNNACNRVAAAIRDAGKKE